MDRRMMQGQEGGSYVRVGERNVTKCESEGSCQKGGLMSREENVHRVGGGKGKITHKMNKKDRK